MTAGSRDQSVPATARFQGRTVVVTGASSGIGRSVAERLAAEGAHVVAVARRRDGLDELVRQLGEDRAIGVTADVTSRSEVATVMATAAERFGGIDVLVSNVGGGLVKEFEEITSEEWTSVMAANVDTCFLCAQEALPHLKKSRGSIVHTSSVAGMGGDRNLTAHSTAKAAVVNFTRSLAFDLGPFGIRVNAVAPGMTASDDVAATEPFANWLARSAERQAIAGHATPADVAAAVAFLASSDARFVTGTNLIVDGGLSAGSGLPPFS